MAAGQKQGGEGTKLKIKLFSRSIKTSNVISCVSEWVDRNPFLKEIAPGG